MYYIHPQSTSTTTITTATLQNMEQILEKDLVQILNKNPWLVIVILVLVFFGWLVLVFKKNISRLVNKSSKKMRNVNNMRPSINLIEV
jgi:type II secretory pathway component PulF